MPDDPKRLREEAVWLRTQALSLSDLWAKKWYREAAATLDEHADAIDPPTPPVGD